ncbi:hypothetical protein G6N76_09850 [Rhizobium daejeonense]|uniref:Uncharacterized protein n=1 Tax=Rhizobium daejeonense TaxID=240521 RepID=A0A6M1S3X7_9HYPH|nr:hypothetical protein [Rhizobium daejeonense]NGO63977.1 hypothetical protein [Rhizobium daejeonense]
MTEQPACEFTFRFIDGDWVICFSDELGTDELATLTGPEMLEFVEMMNETYKAGIVEQTLN